MRSAAGFHVTTRPAGSTATMDSVADSMRFSRKDLASES
jgi:hypothetical protein